MLDRRKHARWSITQPYTLAACRAIYQDDAAYDCGGCGVVKIHFRLKQEFALCTSFDAEFEFELQMY